MEHIGDLFGRLRTIKRDGQILDERSELIRYFSIEVERPAKYVGIRVAHYTLSQLYGLQSGFKDRLHRDGKETALKWWWWITKTNTTT